MYLASFSVAYGFCTWGIVPQNRVFEPLNATEVLIHYDDGQQTLVLRPEFRGNAHDLAIVYPTPSRPSVTEAPIRIFEELNDATNPFIPQPLPLDDLVFSVAEAKVESVTVIEEKQVGDFDVAILTATDSDDLIDWLQERNYEFDDADVDKVDYYVAQEGFYFIALKITLGQAPVLKGAPVEELTKTAPPLFFGELSPLEISFKTDTPQLPMRTLKSTMPAMTFDLYTLGSDAWYIPSVDTVYADIVDKEFLSEVPSLAKYAPQGKWIVRQEVIFEPKNSDQDVYLIKKDAFMPIDPQNQKRFSPGDLNTSTGILPGTRGRIVGESTYAFTRSLTIGSRGEDVRQLQQVLNEYGFTVSATGAGSAGNETTYFGNRTKQALVLFQNFYRAEVLTPVGLTSGTGYFGPSTRTFLNN